LHLILDLYNINDFNFYQLIFSGIINKDVNHRYTKQMHYDNMVYTPTVSKNILQKLVDSIDKL